MRRAYRKGQKVLVDPGVFVASPTCNKPSIPCTVQMDTPEDADQVLVARDSNGDFLYVFYHRIEPA